MLGFKYPGKEFYLLIFSHKRVIAMLLHCPHYMRGEMGTKNVETPISICPRIIHCHVSATSLVFSDREKKSDKEQSMSNVATRLSDGRLKQERQRRGWTREYVAEQIGIAD